jgi:N-acyl-D-aspartate/D-glutamate deacylase
MVDLVIRNARIADGLGNPLVEGDLAVVDGKVSEVGQVTGNGAQELDAEGQVLAPGAVDLHTHYDAQLTWDPTASPSAALGVTTVVTGNCGFGVAPAPLDKRDTILANLAEVEGMSLESLSAGMEWGFESFPEYLDFLTSKGAYPNVAVLASHTVMRTAVAGRTHDNAIDVSRGNGRRRGRAWLLIERESPWRGRCPNCVATGPRRRVPGVRRGNERIRSRRVHDDVRGAPRHSFSRRTFKLE